MYVLEVHMKSGKTIQTRTTKEIAESCTKSFNDFCNTWFNKVLCKQLMISGSDTATSAIDLNEIEFMTYHTE